MSGNALKTAFARTLNEFTGKVGEDIQQLLGKSLPCHVMSVQPPYVTIAFDIASPFTLPQVKMPVAEFRYAQAPVQVGDRGVTIPSGVYLGGASALGGGTADLTQQANLANLVFLPVSSREWPILSPDPDAYFISSPHGAIIQQDAGLDQVIVNEGTVTIRQGASKAVMQNGTVSFIDVVVKLDGIHDWMVHRHTGVATGPDDTGPVDPAWP